MADEDEILRCTQDDRAVLPAALLPTRAHARLRLMGIRADKSALGAINRPLHCPDARLPTRRIHTPHHAIMPPNLTKKQR